MKHYEEKMALLEIFKSLKLDVEMIPAKLAFLLANGSYGAIIPFINAFYVSIGLTTKEAGVISGISLAVSCLFSQLFTSNGESIQRRKNVFLIMCVGTIVSVFAIPWVSVAVTKFSNDDICLNATTTNFGNTTHNCSPNGQEQDHYILFYSQLFTNIIAWVFYMSLRCYVDGLVTKIVSSGQKKRDYGKQRVCGSIGFVIFSFLTGVLCDLYNVEGMSQYMAIFYVFSPCIWFLVPVGLKLTSMEIDNKTSIMDLEKADANSEESVAKDLFVVLKNVDSVFFILTIFVSGLLLGIYNCFFCLLMELEMDASKTQISLSLTVSTISEIIFFISSSKLIKFLGGAIPSVIVGLMSYFPRFVLLSYTTNQWCALATQLFHGLGMGLLWSAAIKHASKQLSVNLRITGIALLSSLHFVASNALANIVGGTLYDYIGARPFFRYFGVFSALWSLIASIFYMVQNKRKTKETIQLLPTLA